MSSWIDFWNRPNAIYVNQRNLEAHFTRLARDLEPHLPKEPGKTILDFGCGDALAAEVVAARAGRLLLFDAAESTRRRLRERFGGHPRIAVLDEAGLAALAEGGVDLILVVSVLQYLSRTQLDEAVRTWRRLLAADGRLLVADVIQPGTPMLRDVRSQLAFARENGFLGAALTGLVRMALSDYGRIRRQAGFACYAPDEMLEILRSGGLAAELLPHNVGPSAHRRSFLARRAAEPAVSAERDRP